jgi:hypothetical protein
MDSEEVLEYRGYLLIRRTYAGTATDSIRRPDGSWRFSPPTFVCGPWSVWVVARRSSDGAVEDLATATGYEAACAWVDRQLQRQE